MFPHAPLAQRIELLSRLTTLERLSLGVETLLREHGIRFFFFGLDRSLSLVRTQLLTLHNLPEPWNTQYLDDAFFHDDPTIYYAREHTQPVDWQHLILLPCCASAGALRVMQQHAAHGLRSGCTLPLRAPGGASGWLNLACDDDSLDHQTRLRDFMPWALLLAGTVLACSLRLTQTATENTLSLNTRERDCLAWASEGLTNAEIGAALGISDRTAIYHITSACRKLGARNRQHAVTRALLSGQIGPVHTSFTPPR